MGNYERAVSVLIAVLDEIDADAEAEPSLGAAVALYPAHDDQRRWADGATDDREVVDEDGGDILDGGDDDRVDGEPSLGATGAIDQTRWGQGGRRDLEDGGDDEHDDRHLPKDEAGMEAWFKARDLEASHA